ncbi:MAG: hypothetical protein ABR585_01460 [Gemmatimonadaceae bacterium]
MLTTRVKRILTLATAVTLAACTDNTGIGPYRDVAGTYQLTVFSGRTLPTTYTYSAGQIQALPNGGTITWTGGTMVLNSVGTFVETNDYTITPNGGSSSNSSFISSGTFTISGIDFTLSAQQQNGAPARFAQGTIENNTINYQEDDGTGQLAAFEYKR